MPRKNQEKAVKITTARLIFRVVVHIHPKRMKRIKDEWKIKKKIFKNSYIFEWVRCMLYPAPPPPLLAPPPPPPEAPPPVPEAVLMAEVVVATMDENAEAKASEVNELVPVPR